MFILLVIGYKEIPQIINTKVKMFLGTLALWLCDKSRWSHCRKQNPESLVGLKKNLVKITL